MRPQRTLARAVALGATAYLTWAAVSWLRYGRRRAFPATGALDQFLPEYEVSEQTQTIVHAPAPATFAAACDIDFNRSLPIRTIFRTRELLLGAAPNEPAPARGLVRQAKQWGWAVLSESPGHEIVFGAVTQPWVPNPVFQGLSPREFTAFNQPGYVKIAWSLTADPLGPALSRARTETRALTTSPDARDKFRLYWAFLSPGIILIRLLALRLVKSGVERQTRT